jgi:hypothetical protein
LRRSHNLQAVDCAGVGGPWRCLNVKSRTLDRLRLTSRITIILVAPIREQPLNSLVLRATSSQSSDALNVTGYSLRSSVTDNRSAPHSLELMDQKLPLEGFGKAQLTASRREAEDERLSPLNLLRQQFDICW